MPVMHSWALLIGAVAIGLPILVHWLTRPRPRRLALSTVRFVREAVHQRRAIHRLCDYLILALRAGAVALLAYAFSRPLIGGGALTTSAQASDVGRVVVLDVSHSMRAVVEGVRTFERARSIAGEHLTGRAGLRANLVLAGAQPRDVLEGLSSNFAYLQAELARVQPTSQRCDANQALLAAAELLAKAPADADHRRELIVITDLQAVNWRDADYTVLPTNTTIQLETVAPQGKPANLAITRVATRGRVEQGAPAAVEVRVSNHSPTTRDVTVDLELGDFVQRLEGVCPAGEAIVLTADVRISESGYKQGQARLVGSADAIAADNHRVFVVHARPRARYGLITRECSDVQASASYFIERALAPQAGRDAPSLVGDAPPAVMRIDPAQLNREMLAPADLLVIVRPGRLDDPAVQQLVATMRQGRPVLYAACETTDAAILQAIITAAGDDLRVPAEFVPGAVERQRTGLRLGAYGPDVSPFAVLGANAAALMEPLRFARALDSRDLDVGLKDDVLARYDDGVVMLLRTFGDAGALAVLNADVAESNIVGSAAFVPLVAELVAALLEGRGTVEDVDCGEPMTAILPPESGPVDALAVRTVNLVAVEGQAGEPRLEEPQLEELQLGELRGEPGGNVWRWERAGPPGVYEVVRRDDPVMAVATGIPAAECDLEPLDRDEVTAATVNGPAVHVRDALSHVERRDVMWTWVAVACVVLMLVEIAALRAFRT